MYMYIYILYCFVNLSYSYEKRPCDDKYDDFLNRNNYIKPKLPLQKKHELSFGGN